MNHDPDDILEFWYTEPANRHWFQSTPELDELIRDRYQALWQQAAEGGLDSWKDTPEGCLALAIVLDQFPLNMFRGQPESFATEQQAISNAVAQLELSTELKGLVFDLLHRPIAVNELAAGAGSIEQKSEVYLASCLAIDPDHPAEQAHLDQLAQVLQLPDGLAEQLQRQARTV